VLHREPHHRVISQCPQRGGHCHYQRLEGRADRGSGLVNRLA
jgi:hypothetical protein